METIETLIPDNGGNHLVVVLYFYEDIDKANTFLIPQEFINLDIADININKLDQNKPLKVRAFFKMCHWLSQQFMLYPNSVFSFICSTDPLQTHHPDIKPEQYRWNLFESLYFRYHKNLEHSGIRSKISGPAGYQTYARVFFRDKHAPIIHFVTDHICSKFPE